MKFRKHHNNKAYRSTKNGKRRLEIKRIAKKLGIRYVKELYQLEKIEDKTDK